MQTLDYFRGDTIEFSILYSDEETGDPIDITGAVIQMQGRDTVKDEDIIFDISTTSGEITIPVGTDGIIQVSIPATTSNTFAIGEIFTDLEMVLSGKTITLGPIVLNITESITRND